MSEWRGWRGQYDGKPRPLTGALFLVAGLVLTLLVRLPGESVAHQLSRSVISAVVGIAFGLAACFVDLIFWAHFPTDAGAGGDRRRRWFRVEHASGVMLVLLSMELVLWGLQDRPDTSLVGVFGFMGTLVAAGFKGYRRPPRPGRPDTHPFVADPAGP
jgi:hypothetical protein